MPVVLSVLHDTFTLRAVRKPVSAMLRKMPREEAAVNREICFGGKPTGIVVPPNMGVWMSGVDEHRKAVGWVTGDFSGAYSGTVSLLVLPRGHGFQLVAPLKGLPCGKIFKRDGRGGFVGVAFEFYPYGLDDPYSHVSHGFLLRGGRITDLGPADAIGFDGQGEIYGSYTSDHTGRPTSAVMGDDCFENRFSWTNGRRTIIGRPKAVDTHHLDFRGATPV